MDQGLKTLAAMDDERMEDCIHCGDNWYVIHHIDGVCHKCQDKGLPGRWEIRKAQIIKRALLNTVLILAGTSAIIYALFMFFE
ncbi:hypothetical protein HQ571_01635 [Candidatus Kuenenbacteria bacterium]|nr:hypothetical protein [Candidatus Kuenenbacteria bacterium]